MSLALAHEGGGGGERGKLLQFARECVQQAQENESWGLFLEAVEELQKASRKLALAATDHMFSSDEKELLKRIVQALKLKASCLQNMSSVGEPSSNGQIDLKTICLVFQRLESHAAVSEILQTEGLTAALPRPATTIREPLSPTSSSRLPSDDDYSTVVSGKAGSLMQRTTTAPGHTYLTITVDRIGLKDPQTYIDPFMTISVKNLSGQDMEAPQDTPVATQREGSCIVFGVPVELQTPTDKLPPGSAIFFELKHYKPKKASVSTRCFSLMEMDELKQGKAVLEIYKKPTDFTRRKLSLLSVKPLYLHLSLLLTQT